MAKATLAVVKALRDTAKNLANNAAYQWGHMGSCNCGNLAQVVTNLEKAKIHQEAMRRHGDWNEQLFDYCPQSGLPFDFIIDEMIDFGFTKDDLGHLEKLSDQLILRQLPPEKRYLAHNKREDVVLYLETWANFLEDQLLFGIDIVLDINESVILPV
jgi:hypothetical protein